VLIFSVFQGLHCLCFIYNQNRDLIARFNDGTYVATRDLFRRGRKVERGK
jgi:hypothetical protein